MGIGFTRVTPVLRILSVEKAKEFYIDWLGFKIEFEARFGENFPLYMGVSRGDLSIHLSEHYGDAIPGAAVRILTNGLDEFLQELKAKDYRYYKPDIHETDWGTREMGLLDPFGNHLHFFEEKK